MNHSILKTVIFDQHRIIKEFEIVKRPGYDFDVNANYIVVGVRRAGKSTLLYSLVQDLIREGKDWNQIIYINFEDDRLSGFTLSDFDDIISIQKELSDKEGWFFFDEVQNIDGWEKFARRMADGKEHVFITGSNSKMLSSEMESKLGGRYLTKYVTPYSFAEYLDARNVNREDSSLFSTKGQGEIRKAFNDYFYYGGLPETLILKNKREYTSNVYSKITLGDIAARNNLRNINGLNLMVKKMAQSVKDELSYSKLHNMLKTIGVNISKDAVIDYVFYTLQSYLIFRVDNYFSKFVEKETTPKYYFEDNGFLNLFLVSQEPRLLENLVAIILKSKYGRDFYYIKTDSLDIDFFVPSTGEVIQVAYSISNISSERETESLVKAKQTLKEAFSFRIISFEEEENLSLKGVDIAVTPIWKFALCSPKSKIY
jgi:uncharacterized protein